MKMDTPPAPSILPLRLDNVSFAIGATRLLHNIDLTVTPGRRLVVLGPNGAGKSLLLRLCHGLIDPTSGQRRWSFGGQRPRAQAMVLQRPILLRRSVRANLDYALALANVPAAQRQSLVTGTLERFGLTRMADTPARRLSGGEQQRVALARAWALQPQVLFLDEPSSALDPSATLQIEAMIETFSAHGITIVMTTHNLGQARRLAQDVAFLHRGRLIEHRPAPEFFATPRTPEAKAFLAGDLIW